VRLSARNQLQGTVVSVELGTVMATVVIRLPGGQELVAAVTRDAAKSLELAEGDSVVAITKATQIIVGKE
jgi:molybdopterin-binding protein